MGSTRHAREVNRARAAYIGAARHLARLMQQIDEVPIDPGARHPLPWTDEERGLVVEVTDAWGQLLRRRTAYEATLREVAER